MNILEQVAFISLGVLISMENFLVVLAAIRNNNLRKNTHYNLVISLSVCDYVVWFYSINYGSVIASISESTKSSKIICEIHYQMCAVMYLMSLLQTFCRFESYLVVNENRLYHKIWNGSCKYLALFLWWQFPWHLMCPFCLQRSMDVMLSTW